jgi:hypothetical protein
VAKNIKDGHVNGTHKLIAKYIKKYGCFWGMIRMMMKQTPTPTIAEALGQGDIWKCTMNDWHLPFQSEKALRHHFTQAYAVYEMERGEVKSRRLAQRWSERIEDLENQT